MRLEIDLSSLFKFEAYLPDVVRQHIFTKKDIFLLSIASHNIDATKQFRVFRSVFNPKMTVFEMVSFPGQFSWLKKYVYVYFKQKSLHQSNLKVTALIATQPCRSSRQFHLE